MWGGSRQAILSVFGPKRGRAHNNSKAIEAVIFLILKNWENDQIASVALPGLAFPCQALPCFACPVLAFP